jgi:N utilization substance protein B
MKKNPKTPFRGRTQARLAAVQALFQIEQTGLASSQVVMEFLELRLKKKKVETTFFAHLTEGAWAMHTRSDEMVSGALKQGWTLDRLESVTRAIFRAALYELLETTTDKNIIINEYLNLTRSFFDDGEVSFVNGVLSTIAGKVRVSDS